MNPIKKYFGRKKAIKHIDYASAIFRMQLKALANNDMDTYQKCDNAFKAEIQKAQYYCRYLDS